MSKTVETDFVIIGGGPAGAASALRLIRAGYSVEVIEQNVYAKDTFHAGEHLAPETRPKLHQAGFDLEEVLKGAEDSPGIQSIWGNDEPYFVSYKNNWDGPGINVDRSFFDAQLLRQVQAAGGKIWQPYRYKSAQKNHDDGLWDIQIRAEKGDEKSIRARFIIDASGRARVFAFDHGEGVMDPGGYWAYVRWYEDAEKTLKERETLYVEGAPKGWWYSIGSPGGGVTVAFLTSQKTLREISEEQDKVWSSLLGDAPHTQKRISGLGKVLMQKSFPATPSMMVPVYGNDWITVGDAASTIDPLSGRGVAWALDSVAWASDALDKYLNGDSEALKQYENDLLKRFQHNVLERADVYKDEVRWSDLEFWQETITLSNQMGCREI